MSAYDDLRAKVYDRKLVFEHFLKTIDSGRLHSPQRWRPPPATVRGLEDVYDRLAVLVAGELIYQPLELPPAPAGPSVHDHVVAVRQRLASAMGIPKELME